MAQLDKLLQLMVAQKGETLFLDEGESARMQVGGTMRPLTKSPLTGASVVGLLKEIGPPDAAKHLDAKLPASFIYTSGDGAFAVKAMLDSDRWRVRIEIDAPGEFRRVTRQMVVQKLPEEETSAASGKPPKPPAGPDAPLAAADSPDGGESILHFEGIDASRQRIDQLLRTMVERGASDLHLRCGEPPIIRFHGEMTRLEGDGHGVLQNDELAAMIKSIMPERNRREFLKSNDTDYAYEIAGCARFRANALKDRMGVAAVFRQIPATVVTVEQMGISQEVQKLCYLTKGLVLVTGPTGSGKSTTLCALVDLVNRARNDHVITIEDPIEFVHPNKNCIITQRQVGVHTSSFKAALRAALREDPDIILVGELRDLETVSIAIETAETGHLVFGTLHTTTAAGTVDRMIDQFPADRQSQIRMMLADSLKGVISQILCKKIGGGRVAAREILLTTPAVTNLIRESKTFQLPSVMQTSKKAGMITLNDALGDLVDAKLVEPSEGYTKAVDKTGFVALMKSRGHDVSFAT